MQPPKIDKSTREERQAYVLEAWKCLHDCEACGKQVAKQTISELNKANVNGWKTAKSDFLALST